MVAVPAATPVTVPDAEPIEAIVMSELAHVPPAVALVSVPEFPTQAESVPPITAGKAKTVTFAVRRQPVDKV